MSGKQDRIMTSLAYGIGLKFSEEVRKNIKISEYEEFMTADLVVKMWMKVWAEELQAIEFDVPAEDDPTVKIHHTVKLVKAFPQLGKPQDYFDGMAGVLKLTHSAIDPRDCCAEPDDDDEG